MILLLRRPLVPKTIRAFFLFTLVFFWNECNVGLDERIFVDALTVNNPILTARSMQALYAKMNDVQFADELQRVLSAAEEFQRHDDSKYVATLNEHDATSYANHIRAWVEAIGMIKKVRAHRAAASPALAHAVAMWKLISDFRTLNGDDSK
jgi:hypothetical protein